ncbi:MarR family transcriptional regulator [Persephonella atlantica]|uniref:MarR family transcriptional regulator n=1 Tax=Persephonella atlantica TaxID=2699429 RepID=A0ABS1GFT6_9AQUI|nr:MarR family transcriptional regulator [Persephonella atlantica]
MNRKKVFDFIANSNKPVKVGDIEKATGLDRNSVQKIVNHLAVEGLIELDRCHNKILGLKGDKDG